LIDLLTRTSISSRLVSDERSIGKRAFQSGGSLVRTRPSTSFGLVTTRRARDAAPIFHYRLVALGNGTSPSTGAARTTAFATNRRHVLTIATHRLAALASCDSGFVGRPFVSRAFLVRGTTALAGDFSLPRAIH